MRKNTMILARRVNFNDVIGKMQNLNRIKEEIGVLNLYFKTNLLRRYEQYG